MSAGRNADLLVTDCSRLTVPSPGAGRPAGTMAPFPHIPGYELVRPLGGGPLTQVYAARRATGEPCALKLPRDHWPEQSTAVRLLRREARALSAVRHSHLVRLVDAHVTGPPYFLVFELLAGESLRERLEREYALDLR